MVAPTNVQLFADYVETPDGSRWNATLQFDASVVDYDSQAAIVIVGPAIGIGLVRKRLVIRDLDCSIIWDDRPTEQIEAPSQPLILSPGDISPVLLSFFTTLPGEFPTTISPDIACGAWVGTNRVRRRDRYNTPCNELLASDPGLRYPCRPPSNNPNFTGLGVGGTFIKIGRLETGATSASNLATTLNLSGTLEDPGRSDLLFDTSNIFLAQASSSSPLFSTCGNYFWVSLCATSSEGNPDGFLEVFRVPKDYRIVLDEVSSTTSPDAAAASMTIGWRDTTLAPNTLQPIYTTANYQDDGEGGCFRPFGRRFPVSHTAPNSLCIRTGLGAVSTQVRGWAVGHVELDP